MTIRDIQYKLDEAIYKASDYTYGSWGASAIAWYVNTGRASNNWCKALLKANLVKLLNHIIKSQRYADAEMIETTTKYLKRYCGLTA